MRHRGSGLTLGFAITLIGAMLVAGCAVGPSVSGSFDRTLTVTAPIRLEVGNASGDVSITGSADGKVHVHGDVKSYGMGFGSPKDRLNEIVTNPPVEQKGDVIRIGKDLTRVRNISIAYVIEVPRETEVSTMVASGSQTIRDVRGPVKAEAASGSINAEHIERSAQLTTMSGSIDAKKYWRGHSRIQRIRQRAGIEYQRRCEDQLPLRQHAREFGGRARGCGYR